MIDSRANRKALEAKIANARRLRRVGAVLAALAVVGGAVFGVRWWQDRPDDTALTSAIGPVGKDCANLTPVTLWAAPSIQPAAVALAKAFQAQPDSPCVDYQVIARKPIEAMIGLGQGQPNRPDGWIPDSPRWVERVNAAAKLNAQMASPFAKSPLVVAMDPASAAKFDSQPKWLELVGSASPIRLSDPRSTTAGMLALASALPQLSPEQGRDLIPKLAKNAAPSTDQLFSDYRVDPATANAFPVSESELAEHNRVRPENKMVSVTPLEGTPSFEFSLVNVATNPTKGHGIETMRAFLRTQEAARILASFGLRSTSSVVTMPTPVGSIGEVKVGGTPSAEQVAASTDAWQSATTDFSLLAVFDVSGSMNEKVGKTTRAAITQEAAGIALNALPATTRIGLWVFSIDKGGPGRDHKELVPMGVLSDNTHRARMAVAAGSLTKEVGGGTGLYDTIWAAYQKVKAGYDPTRVNAVVILTDGKNEDGKGLSFEQLKANLRAASDPKKPIAITTIGIGPAVDSAVLTEISKMAYSNFYAAPSPGDMTTVLAKALFDHQCKDGVCV